MGLGLPLETASIAFIARWTLSAALVVGAGAGAVMVFAGLAKGRRRDVLQFAEAVAGPQLDTGRSDSKSGIDVTVATRDALAGVSFGSLEADRASRAIHAEGRLVLISRLSRFKGTELDVLVYSESADALLLARAVWDAVGMAGWNVRIWNKPTARSVRGLHVQTRRGSDQTVQDPGVKLMLALQEAGLGARASQPFDPNDPPDDGTGPAFESGMIAPIRLLIGSGHRPTEGP
jgi:hypothetical protein